MAINSEKYGFIMGGIAIALSIVAIGIAAGAFGNFSNYRKDLSDVETILSEVQENVTVLQNEVVVINPEDTNDSFAVLLLETAIESQRNETEQKLDDLREEIHQLFQTKGIDTIRILAIVGFSLGGAAMILAAIAIGIACKTYRN